MSRRCCTTLAYKLSVKRLQASQVCLKDVVERAHRVFASTITDTPSVLYHADWSVLELHSHAQKLEPLAILFNMLLHGLDLRLLIHQSLHQFSIRLVDLLHLILTHVVPVSLVVTLAAP